jgi:ABC-type glycerol-3-phosphate transport system substrate-binding protein
MKKYTFILALGVALTLTACGSGSTSNQTTDSTAVQSDTTSVLTDSTVSGGAPANPSDLNSDVKKPTSNEEVK